MERQSTTDFSDNSPPPVQPSVAVHIKSSLIGSVVLAVFISAVVFGMGGYYLGNRSRQTNAARYQEKISPLPSRIPGPSMQQFPASTAVPATEHAETHIGYITSVFSTGGRTYGTIDFVEWLDQSKGECRFSSEKQSTVPECNPNGYLVVNGTAQIRTFEINTSVIIDFSDFKNVGLAWKHDQPLTSAYITSEEFQEIFSGNDSSITWLKDALYWITVSNGSVVRIRYQYQP